MTFPAGRALLALLAAQVPQATLEEARIHIAVAGDTARVTARYRVIGAGDALRFNAVRSPSPEIRFDQQPADPPTTLDTLPGLFRLTAAGGGRSLTLELRYTARGDLSRIPLFVPEAPTQPGRSRIAILVDGVAPERVARYTVPRFIRDPDGAHRATPDHLPSVVALVREDRGLPIPALAQVSVLVTAIGGTLVWLGAQLAARRRE